MIEYVNVFFSFRFDCREVAVTLSFSGGVAVIFCQSCCHPSVWTAFVL